MSIIRREAELKYPTGVPGMDPAPLRSGYLDGADREFTQMEVEAAAHTLAKELDNADWGGITPHQRFMYWEITQKVLDAARNQALKEE